jgi:hypothetical protein
MHYMCSALSPSSQKSSTPNTRPRISGIILQAPVSDREAILESINSKASVSEAYKEALDLCASTPKALQSKALLPWNLSYPLVGSIPMTLTRFLSLASPDSPASPGPDDYFSSDLSDETFRSTFGKLASCQHVVPSKPSPTGGDTTNSTPKSMLILVSGSDEHVNKHINKEQLMSRWGKAIESPEATGQSRAILSPHSLVVKNALHDISGSTVETRTARLIDMRGAVLSYLSDVVGDLDDSNDSKSSPWGIWREDKSAIEAERGLQGIKL